MKKFIYILIFLQLIHFTLQAQTLFTKTYGAFGEFNTSHSVAQSLDGNYLFLGSTGGWGAINGDIALVKTDTLGNIIWTKIYGNDASEVGVSIRALNDNGSIFIGTTNDNSNGDYNIIVTRVDSIGEILWSKILGSPSWDIAKEIIQLNDGGFAIASTTYESPFESGTFDLMKIDSVGNLLWETRFPLGNSNIVGGIDELEDGTILIGGQGIQSGHSDKDLLLVKYSSVGDTLWSRYYGGIEDEWITDIAHAYDQRICIVGNKTQIEGNTRSLVKISNSDGFIIHSNDYYSTEENMLNSVFYSEIDSTFISAGEFSNSVVTRATLYKWDLYGYYSCGAAINPIATSHIGEAVSTNDGHFLLTGTFNSVGPGITSFFLVKSKLNCFSNLNLIIGIDEINNNIESSNTPFPNPSSGTFNISLNIEPELIDLIDLTGKEILFSKNYHAGILSIDAGSIAPGMYVLKLRTNQNSPTTYHSIIISR
jgi:hypothetical protein